MRMEFDFSYYFKHPKKHYRIIEKYVYIGTRVIGSYYSIQKRCSLFLWEDIGAVPQYDGLSNLEAAEYRCNLLEEQYIQKHYLPKHRVI